MGSIVAAIQYDSPTKDIELNTVINGGEWDATDGKLLDIDYSSNELFSLLYSASQNAGIAFTADDYTILTGDLTFSQGTNKYTSRERRLAELIKTYSDGGTLDYNELGSTPITQLANYFKITCYDYDDESGGLKNGKINPIHVLLYVIFVVQSLLYFFAYVKRLFYIIVLAMMAPIIVTYNFVTQI